MRSQTSVGILVSCWHPIWSGFGLKICKPGMDPDSKKAESTHFCHLFANAHQSQ